jgi:Zn-dependent protease
MNEALIRGLLMYLGFVGFVVLHEYAHAWMAVRCGDETPRLQGRLTLDPIAHMDLIGTVILPLAVTFFAAQSGSSMLMGWGRPVEVNLNNFRVRRRDDILVSVAGPVMNILTAIGVLIVMKIMAVAAGATPSQLMIPLQLAALSLFLCFFNLLPIPPLDGGHITRNLIGMSDETYAMMSRFSFIFLIIIISVPVIGRIVNEVTFRALGLLMIPFGW